MSIPSEVSLIFDDYHIDSLYHVCRFCFNRLSSKARPKESRRQPLTQLVIDRALKQYQIDFRFEISDLKKPKVLCSGCRTRLANLETGKMTGEKWNKDRPDIEILPMIEDQYHTRGTVGCRPENRCHVCQINASSLNNFLVKLKCYGSRPGRPLLQSPCKPMCSKCGMYLDIHDDGFCKNIFKHPQSSLEAGKHFAERVEARGFTSNLASKYIKDTIEHKRIERSDPLNSPIELNHPYDSNNRIAVTTVGYQGRGTVLKQLSVEAARDIQRLGNIGLGKKAYYDLGRILRQEGIKGAWDEKWSVFGNIFVYTTLQLYHGNQSITPEPTPFGFCLDIEQLLNIVTYNQAKQISRLKLQVDGGKEFLKMSVNIISMSPDSLYTPTPNSVLSNFVIAMGHGVENYYNLKQLFTYPSIRKLFALDIPIQISCDFKVAALLVGIQQASSNYPCPFCLWRKGTICTGMSNKSRRRENMAIDLNTKQHNVINEPIIDWSESVMEKIALAPSHVLLGLVNRLYGDAKPDDRTINRKDRQLYKLHCRALHKCNIFRSEYWNGTLEGNSCSKLLDHLDDIPFPKSSTKFLNALKSLKVVKDSILGKVRKTGWQESIQNFRRKWHDTGLPWSLKSHVLSDHFEEYFYQFESIPDAGAAISSEQSGEMLHSRIQRVWDLRFKTRSENFLYPQRLVDCMVTYNYNLNWDKSSRSLGSSSTNTIDDNHEVNIEIESDDLDIERIELHNWLTDSDNSDQSDCD